VVFRYPYVYLSFDFIFKSLKANSDNPRLPTSARLCPASESNDNESIENPTITSMTTNNKLRKIPMINDLLTVVRTAM
jgi:hypothetical protein